MSVSPGRHAALHTLLAVSRGRRLDRALEDAVDALGSRDRRWVWEAAHGTVRWRGRLDHLLDHHLHRGISSVEPVVLEILRLGAYQLLYMDSVPDYAAVSQAVEMTRASGSTGLASLVNAVLRSLVREGENAALFPDPDEDPAAYLAAWGSHPSWLVERWLTRWSFAEVRALVEANNRIPPVYLTVLEGTPEEAADDLRATGIDARPVGRNLPCLELAEGSDTEAALRRIPAVAQDPAAFRVTAYADPPEGAFVADLCAAPGGKALALAAGGHYVLAADRSRPRLGLVRENAERTGIAVGLVAARAEDPPVGSADVVVVDVPCSGTGTLRRSPDARWRLRPADLSALIGVQDRILDGAASVVPSGGILVYATCSLEPEENEARIDTFLERWPDFRIEPTETVEPALLDEEGRLSLVPQETGFDGAFAARLRRA